MTALERCYLLFTYAAVCYILQADITVQHLRYFKQPVLLKFGCRSRKLRGRRIQLLQMYFLIAEVPREKQLHLKRELSPYTQPSILNNNWMSAEKLSCHLLQWKECLITMWLCFLKCCSPLKGWQLPSQSTLAHTEPFWSSCMFCLQCQSPFCPKAKVFKLSFHRQSTS